MLGKILMVVVGAVLFYLGITEYLIPQFYQYKDGMWYAFIGYLLLGVYYIMKPEPRRTFWG